MFRRVSWGLLLLLLVTAGGALAQDADPVDLNVYATEDSLTLLVTGDTFADLSGIGYQIADADEELVTFALEDYDGFTFPFDSVPAPLCYRLELEGATSALPEPCQLTITLRQALDADEAFWLADGELRAVAVTEGEDLVGSCPVESDDPFCVVTWGAPVGLAALPERGLFRIVPAESEARYLIEETLLGNRITVVGSTQEVAGDVIVNFLSPAGSQLGTIAVNARTFQTDDARRDQAVRGRILLSAQDEFEFITFAPTALIALTGDPVAVGDTVEFEIAGDLTVREVTREVIFTASVTIATPERIEGLVTTEIFYPDFNLVINAPPTISDIAQTIGLEVEFVAELIEAA
ncbi:MAG: YceI family protein [Chloroflexi bacterium]|nr:YceI family protein [Chloroflexota bacterium]